MYFRFSSSASCITFDDDGNLDLHTHNRPKYTHTSAAGSCLYILTWGCMLVRLVIGPSIRLLGSQRSSGRPRDGRRWQRFFEKVIGQMHPHCTAAYSVYTHRQTVASILRIEFETHRHLARRVSPRVVYTWYSKRRPFRPRKKKHTSKKTARRLKCRIYIGGYWRYQRRPGPANKIKQGHLKSHPDRKKKKKISNSHQTLNSFFIFCFVFGGESAFVVILDVFGYCALATLGQFTPGDYFYTPIFHTSFFLFFSYCSAISSFDGWIRAIVPSAVFSQSI